MREVVNYNNPRQGFLGGLFVDCVSKQALLLNIPPLPTHNLPTKYALKRVL